VHTRTDFFTSGQHVVILGGSLLLVLYIDTVHDGRSDARWLVHLSLFATLEHDHYHKE
jgi:hypothetical protein